MLKKTTIAALVIAILGITSVAHATTTASTTFQTPVHVQTSMTTSGCDNSPGPQITLQGAMTVGGLGFQLLFENNLAGTHTFTVDSSSSDVVIPAGQSVTIPKQPVLGRTGGNPFISIQFVDNHNNPLSNEIFLGRCVQGLFNTSVDLSIPATATAQVSGGSCDNHGSTISLSGQMSLTGINANLIYSNNDNRAGGTHRHTRPTAVSVVPIPAGQTVQFAKQPPLVGAGVNR